MKNYILPSAILLLFVLGNCTEEIIKIEKQTDTVTVEKFIDRYFAGTDTVEIPVIVEVPTPTRSESDTVTQIEYVHDTIFMQRIDTLWITETTTIYDTVVVEHYSYGDTLFQYGIHNTYSVPADVQPLITEFYKEAFAHGRTPNGGEMIVRVEKMDAVLQAYSYNFYGQIVIVINDNLTKNERLMPTWREMARLSLGKEYSQDPSKLMYPFHAVNVIRWDNRAQHKTELNEFFQ